MKLIGMLDSPYVRRVAVSLQLLGLPFEHQPLSVFSTFEQFRQINPVVKAPTLVCDDGTVLMDSTLILDYAEQLAAPGRSLMPAAAASRLQALRLIGLAMAACEKSVQVVYERNLRPPEKLHQPWMDRVIGQLHAAFDAIEAAQRQQPLLAQPDAIGQAGICVAVAWHFAQQMVADVVAAGRCPLTARFSAQAELLPQFRAAPYGAGTCPASDAR